MATGKKYSLWAILVLAVLCVISRNVHADSNDEMQAFFEEAEALTKTTKKNDDHLEEEGLARRKPKLKACWKDGEPRGRGKWPDKETHQCPSTQEKSFGLCYPHCGENRVGFGPLCWDKCEKTVYKSNGIVFCCDTSEICKELVQDLATKLPKSLVRFALDLAVHPGDVTKILKDFREFASEAMELRLPLCPDVPEPPNNENVDVVDIEEKDDDDDNQDRLIVLESAVM